MQKIKRTDKVLCVCDGGNSRSVALAWIFKNLFDVDAIACGVRTNSPGTIKILMEWADHIIVTDKALLNTLPDDPRIRVYDVGADYYFKGFEQDLIKKFMKYLIHDQDF